METKFIEGTNEQYSIREDGVVIRHYKYRGRKEYNHKIKEDVIIEYKKHPTRNCNYIVVNSNNKIYNWFKNSLLAKYFNIIICPNCNKTIKTTVHIRVCDKCIKETLNKLSRKWRKNNPELSKLSMRKSFHKNYHKYRPTILEKAKTKRTNITKNYVSSKLNIPINDLTDDMYNLFKANLKIKRLLSEKTGIPTNLIK
jgi:hypothetical protein